jgi:hypothetical protein
MMNSGAPTTGRRSFRLRFAAIDMGRNLADAAGCAPPRALRISFIGAAPRFALKLTGHIL